MLGAQHQPVPADGELPLLHAAGATDYLAGVRERTLSVLARRGVGDGTMVELVLRHELQHTETMRQAMALAGLLPRREPPPGPGGDDRAFVLVLAGPFAMGAGPEGFAYDNERPRHTREVPVFRIARRPVTNAMWLDFSESAGYRQRAWWSDEGWAWKEASAAGDGSTARAHLPDAPVCHVSEYSEVFFGDDYRVLRGASWATDRRVATPTFRNWDRPQRRQVFAGLRLVLDTEAK